MTGKTHIAIGIAAALTISYGQPLENQSVIVLVSAISSLIPDLDHPKGKINQKILLVKNNFYRVSFYVLVGIVFTYLYYLSKLKFLLFLGIGSFLVGISSHRGFTHSIVGFLVSTTIVSLGKLDYGLDSIYSGFIIGYFLHIVADLFTSKGVKLFYPLNNKISFPITIKTNSKFEKILFRLLVIYCVWLLLIQVI
ncbi:metal-dependent hydrolase [Tissierella sp. MB52-C2]|uniref:metal-dependent hydrolase n=1 Tax=Tissierella sp. MB52-C2 TaxID=3070999 RepID=UPI00280B9FCA|nr:metal-dependent hydrolase [Tissierella sp. MB52-C2]WMM23886.1 metal-dependent hydrolase [Tissierella sp. MB52-C2]